MCMKSHKIVRYKHCVCAGNFLACMTLYISERSIDLMHVPKWQCFSPELGTVVLHLTIENYIVEDHCAGNLLTLDNY